MTDESGDMARRPADEEVIEETINAYRVQKLANGKIRIKAGGHVVVSPTYFEALERYAAWQAEEIEEGPDHLRKDKLESIYDGYIPLKKNDSSGFTPREIIEHVTGSSVGSSPHMVDSVPDFDQCPVCKEQAAEMHETYPYWVCESRCPVVHFNNG